MNILQSNNSDKYKLNIIKLLAYFMVIMIILTIFSNIASSLTVSIVTVGKTKKTSINHSVTASGTIEADDEINIIADKGLTIKDINIKVGDTVAAGDTLMTLDLSSLENSIFNVETEIKKLNLELSQLGSYLDNTIETKEAEIAKKQKEIENTEKSFDIKIKQANEDINIAKEDILKANNRLSLLTQKDKNKQLDDTKELIVKLEQNLEDLIYQKEKDLKESQFNIDNAEFNLASIIKNEEAFASEELKKAEQHYKDVESTWKDKTNSINEDLQLSYINWQSLQEAYNQAVAQGDTEHAEQYRQQMEEYKDDYMQKNDKMESSITQKDDALKKAEQAIEAAKTEKDVTIQAQKDRAQMEMNQAQEKYNLLENDYNRKIEKAQNDLDEANKDLNKLLNGDYDDSSTYDIEQSIENLEKVLKAKQRELEDIYIQKQLQLDEINNAIENLNIDILNEQKNQQLTLEKNNRAKDKILIDINTKNRELEQLNKIHNKGSKIISPVSGIITSIKTEIGRDTTNEVIATIAENKSQYYIKIKANKKEAKYIEQGDEASITFTGETIAIEGAKVASITNLKADDSDKVEIKILLPKEKGELGMSAYVEIDKLTDKYQTVIPITALRQDSSGEKYVLVTSEQNTILGKQLIAQKVVVTEIDKDNYNVAVQGNLTFESQIIINSNKPIVAGNRVRLIEQ